MLVLTICLSTACHHYYMTVNSPAKGAAEVSGSVDSLQNASRVFILRNGNDAYMMTSMQISEDRKTLHCALREVPPEHQSHFTFGVRGRKIYQPWKAEGRGILNEVHLYTTMDTGAGIGEYTLDLDRVEKIEVIEKDRKRTTSSYVIGAVGYTLGAVVVVAIIVAATKSSCPFIAAYDGNEFALQGEAFGGAIYPQLARHDYIPLKMAPLPDGSLQVKITNELKERQYTDMAELLVVDHDPNSNILVDENGNLYSVANPQAPLEARLGKKSVLSAISQKDDNAIVYLDDSSRADARNELYLTFAKPAACQQGKLVLNLKNSYWLDLLYGKLAEGLGRYYPVYLRKQRKASPQSLLTWIRQQQIPLDIEIKSGGSWKNVTSLLTIGPLANRQIVVPLNLEPGQTVAEIKLGTGFFFWEIDYAALDLSPQSSFSVQRLKPAHAIDEYGQDLIGSLEKEDGRYLEQPEIGNSASLEFMPGVTTPVSGSRTYFLHVKGYYEHIRDFKNRPDIPFITQFRKPNAFPVYGLRLFREIRQENQSFFASNTVNHSRQEK